MKKSNQKHRYLKVYFGQLFRIALLSVVFLLLNVDLVCAQGKLTGFIVDDEFEEPLEKAVISIPRTFISVLTDQQGKYLLKMRSSDYFLEVNYPGYFGRKFNMSVIDGIVTPMSVIKLKPNKVGEGLQRSISSRENKKEFPLTIEDFSTWQVAEQVGRQEFNALFQTIPSVSILSNGSGYNDSDLGFRGNDPARTSYTFNGILLNNPETGRLSSATLSGLSDWTGNLQVTSGTAANLQSQTSYGGLVNVQSFLPHEKAGTDLQAIYGNNGFLKTSATIFSGLSKKGLASSFQISRTSGDGLAQNTAFGQYSLFADVHKEFSQFHTLVFSVNATIQKHDRNYADSIGAYNRYDTRYNQNWGNFGEKHLSWSTSYERSPMISLTHFWKLRIKSRITTQFFARFNRSAQLMPGGKPLTGLPRDSVGHLLFDQIYGWNNGQDNPVLGAARQPDVNGKFVNTETSGISTLAAVDKETRLGIRSVLAHRFSKQLDLSGSFNLEYYKARHFGTVNDLLGADSFTSFSDVNHPEGFPVDVLFQSKFIPSYKSAGKVGWNYISGIQTGGISLRLNYLLSRYFWFFEGVGSFQNIRRTDLFSYANSDSERHSTALIPAGRAQAGIRMNLWKYHSIRLNAGYGSYQPMFTTIFPSGNNWKNQQAKNEQVFNAEFGYTIFSRKLKVEALAYFSQIANHSQVRYLNANSGNTFGLINGLAETHQGVELKTSYKLTKNFQLNLNGSLGDWKYSKDAKVQIYDSNNQQISENDLWINGIRIANAPQISLFAEAEYRWAHNFYVRLNYYRAERLFAPFGLNDFKNLAVRRDFKQWQIPKYDLVGFSGNYLLKYRKLPAINLIFGGSNLLDTDYIEQSATNIPEGNSGYTSNQVYYGMGKTWFAGLKIQF
jgi:iron complex outermembrane receptor protein